jgi:hypothetical protein
VPKEVREVEALDDGPDGACGVVLGDQFVKGKRPNAKLFAIGAA